MLHPIAYALRQSFNGLGLVTSWLKLADHFQWWHLNPRCQKKKRQTPFPILKRSLSAENDPSRILVEHQFLAHSIPFFATFVQNDQGRAGGVFLFTGLPL
jgi:hypothetical protein